MAFNTQTIFLALAVITILYFTSPAEGARDRTGTCIRNCAQCERMFGAFFEGELCANSCIKHKGTSIPDCEDINTIVEFVHRPEHLEEDD